MTRKYQGLNRVTLGLVEAGVTAGTLYSRYSWRRGKRCWNRADHGDDILLVPIRSATFSACSVLRRSSNG